MQNTPLAKIDSRTPGALAHSASWMSLVSLLPHLLCCGLPLAMGLVGLGSVLGLTLSQTAAPFFTAVDAYHGHFLALAVTMVMLSGSLHLLAWRLDCRTAQQSACAHTDCTPQKSRSLKVFYLSCALLVLDVLWFSLLHHH